jgi:hypothetical protein
MFAPAYMGRKRCFRMLLLRSRTVLSGTVAFTRTQKRSKGLRPAVFVPRTLRRTWGTPPDLQRRREYRLLLARRALLP